MYYPQTTRPRFSGGRLIGMTIFLLIILVPIGLFYLLGFSVLQARFAGVQTTAIAHEIAICPGDSNNPGDSYAFNYEFTTANGQHYNLNQDGFCTNIYNDGDHVTIWYMANDPQHFATDLQVHMTYIFTAIGLVIDVPLLLVFLRLLFRPFRRARATIYGGYPYNPQ